MAPTPIRSETQEKYEAAYRMRQALRAGDYRPAETGMVIHPQPYECPRCGDATEWCAVDVLHTRFVCDCCGAIWGSPAEPKAPVLDLSFSCSKPDCAFCRLFPLTGGRS